MSVENRGIGTKGMPRLFIKGESTEVGDGEGDVGWLIIWSIAKDADYVRELLHGDVFLAKNTALALAFVADD